MVGAIILSPTDAASLRVMVGPAQRGIEANAYGLHVTQPYSILSSTSALSIRVLSSRGALGRSYNSRVYFRKLHHAMRMRRLTSMDRSAFFVVDVPPEVYELVRLVVHLARCLYADVAVDSSILFVCKHMISVFTSNVVRPNAAHTTATTPIIFLSCSGDCKTTPASSA